MSQVLLVETDDARLQSLEEELGNSPLVRASSTQETASLLRAEGNFKLLITPAKAPQVDGFQIALAAREFAPEARLVILTDLSAEALPLISEHCIAHYVDANTPKEDLALLGKAILEGRTDAAGILDDLELIDIVVLACLGHRSAVLHVHHDESKGRIIFAEGQIRHAEFQDLLGAPALFELLALQQGDIFMQSRLDEFDVSIEENWLDLLSEGLPSIERRRLELTEQAVHEVDEVEAITDSDVAAFLGVQDYPEDGSSPGSSEAMTLFSKEEIIELEELHSAEEIASENLIPIHDSAPFPLPEVAEAPQDDAAEWKLESLNPRAPIQNPEDSLSVHDAPTAQPRIPLPTSRPAPPPRSHTSPLHPRPGHKLHSTLDILQQEIPEFLASSVVNLEDGFSVASLHADAAFDISAASAFYSDFLASCTRAVQGFGLHQAQTEDVLLTTAEHYVLLRPIQGTTFVHMLWLGRDGNLGIAKVTMRRYEPSLAQALPH